MEENTKDVNSVDQTQDVTDLAPVPQVREEKKSQVNQSLEEFQKRQDKPKKSILGNRNVKLLLIFSVVFLLLIVLLFMVALLKKSQNSSNENVNQAGIVTPTEAVSVKVSYLEGTAKKLSGGNEMPIAEGDTLKEPDEIKTGDNSKLVLSFNDGSVVRLGSNTDVILTSLSSTLMNLTEQNGELFAKVEKDSNHKFVVSAGDYQVVSEGTAFSVTNKDSITVNVFDSSVKVTQGEKEVAVGTDQTWQQGESEIKTIDKKKLASDEFLNWSLKEEKLNQEPTDVPAPSAGEAANVNQIKLTGESTKTGLRLNWTVTDSVDVSKGFKLVKNIDGSPKYPGDSAVFQSSEIRTYLWNVTDGKTWHVRVCQFTGDGCGVYSNEVTIQAPNGSNSSVTKITLTGEFKEGVAKLNWKVEGNSPLGYKVVWSKNSNPTYPLRDGDQYKYLDNPDSRSASIEGLSAGWDYYIRVCEYLGGKCGVYSNEVILKY